MPSLWVGSPKKRTQHTHVYFSIPLQRTWKRTGRCEQRHTETGVNTYSSVKERYVKMSACCKHWQQRHRNLLAGIVYIYGFSSRQPQWPAKKQKREKKKMKSEMEADRAPLWAGGMLKRSRPTRGDRLDRRQRWLKPNFWSHVTHMNRIKPL